MSQITTLEFHAPGPGITYRAKLLPDQNPDVVKQVMAQLPLRSVLGHVVVSGESFWMPSRIVHLGGNNMVQRTIGAVYLYAPGQTIVTCYGRITETAKINKFGEVLGEDIEKLVALGRYVYEETVAQPRRSIIEINVRGVA